MTGRKCDNTSVGVIAERTDANGNPRWLLIWRATFPFGVAPVAGHVFDDHPSFEQAARAELKEEAGLEAPEVHRTAVGGWRPNRCRRAPGVLGTGHEWEVYTAYFGHDCPPLSLSAREVKKARWLSAPELQMTANRTVLHALGRILPQEWEEAPGIEPVWMRFLAELDVIRVRRTDLELVDDLVANAGAAGEPPSGQ